MNAQDGFGFGLGHVGRKPCGSARQFLVQFAGIFGRYRGIGAVKGQIAGHDHRSRAEIEETVGIVLRSGEHGFQMFHQGLRQKFATGPCCMGPLGQMAVDDNLGNAPLAHFGDHHGPDFAGRDQGKVRLPVVQKTGDGRFEIERHILMYDVGVQARQCTARAGDRARGDEDTETGFRQMVRDGGNADRLGPACRMDPDQRTGRPWFARMAVAFLASGKVFLAAPGTRPDIGPHERIKRRPGKAVSRKHGSGDEGAHGVSVPALAAVPSTRS